MFEKTKNLIDIVKNIIFCWLFIGELSSLALCLIFGFKEEFYIYYGKDRTIVFIVVFAILSLICFALEQYAKRKNIKISKDLYQAKRQVNKLIELNDVLFREQLISLHNDIDCNNQNMRISLYIYDDKNKKFYLLNRFSNNDIYGSIDNNKVYDNKGWLHLSFNKKIYIFSCKETEDWIKKCYSETKKNCSYKNCKNKLSGKDCNANFKNCILLSNTTLKSKRMKSLSAFGIPIKNSIQKSIGVLLVEDTKVWSENEIKKIQKCLFNRVHASSEIINLFYRELLDLKKSKQTPSSFNSLFEKIGDTNE